MKYHSSSVSSPPDPGGLRQLTTRKMIAMKMNKDASTMDALRLYYDIRIVDSAELKSQNGSHADL